jgi:spore maturation protein CgeB
VNAPIRIAAFSDCEQNPNLKLLWGDYWLKNNLTEAFQQLGATVDDEARDGVVLHLFGCPIDNLSSNAFNILWLHSHPDWITPEILQRYDKIFCLSKPFIPKLNAMGAQADWLMMPTVMKPLQVEKQYDVVFVGNVRHGHKGRRIINDLIRCGSKAFNIHIWGFGWRDLIPTAWYRGLYYEYTKLNMLYSKTKIVLNDHHDDMSREGFINPRILDAIASGSLVISDYVAALSKHIHGEIPIYRTAKELKALIAYYLTHESERQALVQKLQNNMPKFTFIDTCKTILKSLEQ